LRYFNILVVSNCPAQSVIILKLFYHYFARFEELGGLRWFSCREISVGGEPSAVPAGCAAGNKKNRWSAAATELAGHPAASAA
jgi:hypothetical protein